jgi:hypothetical protein
MARITNGTQYTITKINKLYETNKGRRSYKFVQHDVRDFYQNRKKL